MNPFFFLLAPTSNALEHSAKGTTWKNHRYVTKKKGPSGKWVYIYKNKPSSIKDITGETAKENLKDKRERYEHERKFESGSHEWLMKEIHEKDKEGEREALASYVRDRNRADFAFKQYLKAEAAYSRTPLYKTEKAKEKAMEIYYDVYFALDDIKNKIIRR